MSALLLQCRSTLRWTYVYGFYIDDAKKQLFEYMQDDLEKSTELLSEVMEQVRSACVVIVMTIEGHRESGRQAIIERY